jgi:hypothetical protein
MSDEHAAVPGELRFGDHVEIVTDPDQVKALLPSVTVRAARPGAGDGDMFVVRINQPSGRAMLIAVHL